ATSQNRKNLAPVLSCPQGAKRAPHPARFAQFKVSVRLIPEDAGSKNYFATTTVPAADIRMNRRPRRPAFQTRNVERLLAVLLDARCAQPSEPMLINRGLPGEELFDRQRITGAGFLEGQQAATHSGDDLSLSADDPAFGRWWRHIRNGQRTAIRPDYVFDPRAMGFGHLYTHKTRLD